MSDSKLGVLKKLRALIDHDGGNENEKNNARRLLDNLMQKYNVSDVDIQNEALSRYDFKYSNHRQGEILAQVIFKTMGDVPVHTYRKGGRILKEYGVDCTKAQAMEIEFLYSFYKNLWAKEEEHLMVAFVNKHRLFSGRNKGRSDISDDELQRLIAMMRGLEDASPLKQIEHQDTRGRGSVGGCR